ncbi:hypothetical protein E5676_scaffold77438G00020 [Cucumis melo var. makuwa]|uniref:Uncharacterized protein n=1 Tax=Cucumis melo var. makuwa TaxID=1194695 RepID=A0A5D3DUC5_CUCMM|nr:hypothetical protein E5676_scaffold77438G00020 [Cucumis melo var. makuwa]
MKDQVFFSLSLSFSTTLISKGSSSFALRLVFQYRAPFSLPRLHLRNTPSGNFALLPSIFTLRHADSPFVIRRGIRPRGISIGTSPISHVGDRDTRAMDKDVDRSPYLDNYIEADRSGDAPSSMSEPFRNWLGMGATRPARIQPGSISHVPFPTILPCLGASLACREKARLRSEKSLSLPFVQRGGASTEEERAMHLAQQA